MNTSTRLGLKLHLGLIPSCEFYYDHCTIKRERTYTMRTAIIRALGLLAAIGVSGHAVVETPTPRRVSKLSLGTIL